MGGLSPPVTESPAELPSPEGSQGQRGHSSVDLESTHHDRKPELTLGTRAPSLWSQMALPEGRAVSSCPGGLSTGREVEDAGSKSQERTALQLFTFP